MAYPLGPMTRAPARPDAKPAPVTAAAEQAVPAPLPMLSHAVEEAARLLEADGAMVYLVEDGMMRFAVDAGIRNAEAQQLIRDLTLPIGVGIFGHAAATGELVVSGDYRRDDRFQHSDVADRIVLVANMRSMAAAPLIADGEVLGALGAYSSRINDFDESGLALLRALADHAAAAIANQRLIERLETAKVELARRVDAQRTLGEIAARIAVIREPSEVLHSVVEAAKRLIESDGAHLTLMEPGGRFLRPTVVVGGNPVWTEDWLVQLEFPLNDGINGLAAGQDRVIATEDYLVDPRIPHEPGDQTVAERLELRGMASAPLRGPEGEVMGTLAVSFERPHRFGDDELALLQGLADQGAIAIANSRLTVELRRHADELADRVEAQRTLSVMAAELTSLRDPSDVLIQTLKEAVRLLKGHGGQIGMIDTDSEGVLRWGDGHSLIHKRLVPFTKDDHTKVDDGISGRAVRERRASLTDDYLTDQSFPHDTASDEVAEKLGLRAVVAAPLIGPEGAIGAIGVYSEEPAAFDADSAELLRLLADQAAIVLANAKLNAEAEVSAHQLAHQVEAQRTLGEIAAAITSLRDPSAVLLRTIDEAKRLLHADHVVIHQVRAGTHELADFRTVFGGSPDMPPPDEVTVSIGQGVAGMAIADRRVVWTGDYLTDTSFPHTPRADDWITRTGYRSQMSAPLIGEEGPIGAISAYSAQPDAFAGSASELLGALASQAAIVLGNARLYEELEHRVEAQRTLGAIAARITAIHDPGDVLQRTLDEAVRLLDADGGRIELVVEGGGLHWAFGHSAIDLPIERAAGEAAVTAEEGVSGRAVRQRQVVFTGDYLADDAFIHAEAPDRYIRQHGIRSVMSAPLIGEEGAIGSLTVHSQARDAFDSADAELLEVLASQAAIAVTNARLYEQLGQESAALARQTDSQRRLLEINRSLLTTLDPAGVLDVIADGLKGVVWYDNLGVYRVDEAESMLEPVYARDRNAEAVLNFPIPRGEGLTWWSLEHREPLLINDALNDARLIQIPGTEEEDEAIIIVPLISGDEVIGSMNISRTGGAEVAFTDADFELVQLFAGQASVAITNARLYEQLRERIDAQRTLSEIAAQIAALHEPQTVLDRAVADAARLLHADRAQINLMADEGDHLDRPIAAAPVPPSPDDVEVPIGSGIAGMAAAERRVRWTGDYLADADFPHDSGDARIEAQSIRSMISAPLIGTDRMLGTLTVQSMEANAFGSDDAELLQVLADQAAITLTNARLYAEVEESERRYRHLVDNSPDIVWSVDSEGRFTFFSDSLESRTGWKPADLIGKPFTTLAGEGSAPDAMAAWEALREDPSLERRVRLELPLADGRISKAEVAMTGTTYEGRFAGAHGAVRDISERERLEGDLRTQAAEIAASQERSHLARELHDSVTQALFSMGLTLRTLELLLETDPDAVASKVAELRELQQDALAEMRTLIFELRPSSLESDGLVQALRTHATAVQRRTGLTIVVDAEPVERLPLATEEALYRIGQEAIHNVVKHANASCATIRIVAEAEDRMRLTVTDDGDGFDPADVPRGHLGLIGMRQRVDLVGGELRVESTPGSGTTIDAVVPLEANVSAE
jgi:two-component system, NarL family, sensor histidine kinase UhpB